DLGAIRLDLVARATGKVLGTQTIPATRPAIVAQRAKIPEGLRGDLMNLLLADVDVSALPLQPVNDPQRNWIIRATFLGKDQPDPEGEVGPHFDSVPFCR